MKRTTKHKMPFTSSPSLDDGSDTVAQPGVAIGIGGQTSSAEREAQLEALKAAQSDEVARQQRAVLEAAEARARAQQSEADRQRAMLERRQRNRDEAQTNICMLFAIGIVGYLAYLAFSGVSARRQWLEQRRRRLY